MGRRKEVPTIEKDFGRGRKGGREHRRATFTHNLFRPHSQKKDLIFFFFFFFCFSLV